MKNDIEGDSNWNFAPHVTIWKQNHLKATTNKDIGLGFTDFHLLLGLKHQMF